MHMYYIAIALLIVGLICCGVKKNVAKCIGIIMLAAAVVCGSIGLYTGHTIDVAGLVHGSTAQEEAPVAIVEPVDVPAAEPESESEAVNPQYHEAYKPEVIEPEVSSPDMPQQQPVHTNTNK